MREKFTLFIISSFCLLGLVSYAFAQDEAPLGYYGYGPGSPGKILVTAYMTGPAFTLNMYVYDFGNVEPSTPYIMERGLHIENTGGVNLDFFLYSDNAVTGWNLYVGPLEPGENEFSFYALAGAQSDTLNPPEESHFGYPSLVANQIGFMLPLKEITSEQFYNPSWSSIPGISPAGLNLPAEVPGDPHADEFCLFLRLSTPSWSTEDTFQILQVTIEAHLAE